MIGKNSRYASNPQRSLTREDGSEVRYVRPALLPPLESVPVAMQHRVKDSDRIDILAAQYFGQAESWYLFATASPRPHPDDVLGEPGDQLATPAIGLQDIGPK